MLHHNRLKHILLSIISLLWLIIGSDIYAQNNSKDEIQESRPFFIRLGIDPTRNLQTYLQEADRRGMEFSMDFEYKEKYFPTVETGYYSWENNNDLMEYVSKGTFLRIGCDYNFLSYISPKDRDVYFMGLRYGISAFNQEVPRFSYNNDWGSTNLSFNKETITAHWLEYTVGTKVEIFRHTFLGWTARIKKRIATSNNKVQPYFIPGYGKTKSNTVADVNIYLLIAIPVKN